MAAPGFRRKLERFHNYCDVIKIARSGFPGEKTTSKSIASHYSNCGIALAFFLPSALVILLVLGEGTQRFSIENTAGLFAPFWFRHFPTLPYQRFWEFIEALRKLGHLMGYGLVCLAFFATTYWWLSRRPAQGNWELRNRAAGWALVLTALLGSADELHQRYVPQRTSTITDVGFDLCGGYFALMILFAVLRLWEHKVSTQSPGKALGQAVG